MIHRRLLFSSYGQPNGRDAEGRIYRIELPCSMPWDPRFEHYTWPAV